MSDDLHIFTDVLPTPEARKLLASLQRPSRPGKWQDWSGEGGFDAEVRLNSISNYEVAKIYLPDYVSSIFIKVDEMRAKGASSIPTSLFLGGDDWVIPEYDCSSGVRFEIVLPEINYPLLFDYGRNTNRRFYGRKFNSCEYFGSQACFVSAMYSEAPTLEVINKIYNSLRERFEFSNITDHGFLDELSVSAGGFAYDLDPQKNFWLGDNFRKMMGNLIDESPSENFRMLVQIDIGNTMKFHGEVRNVREDAQELLKRIAERNSYSSYDVTYHVVGPQDWKGRERSRKKWKKPIRQELGTATFEDGTTARVSLRIEKEGYVFTLDFEDVDGLAAFRETKLFQKAHWNLGAE